MVRLGTLSAFFVVALLVSCTGTNPGNNVLNPGQEDFVTLEQGGASFGERSEAGTAGPPSMDNAGAGGGSASAAPSGRTGTVEEGDIYRVDSNRLFYLNTYRGFVIYDVADPAHPAQVSRLPIHGYPIEMYVEGNIVYALLRDALYLTRDATGLQVTRRNVSQLVAIDVSDLAHPKLLKSLDISGQLREGVSRKIDDTLYVVSFVPQYYFWREDPSGRSPSEQAWVYSFNVANPGNPALVQSLRVFEGGGGSTSTGTSSSGTYFQGVAISATANTLHVVENWSVSSSTWSDSPYPSCGTYQYLSKAKVTVVDISDPAGKIREHAKFETYGSLTDQFKQTYVYDETSHKAYYLGVFARQEWSSSGCWGGSFIQNTLEAWDVTDGTAPKKVSALPFGKPNETVRGSAFDLDRKVLFAITAQRIDPLYAISFADPTSLKVLSAIDGLSGDMTVFRLIEQGKYLLGIGRDNSDTCTGFGSPTTGWSSNIAVSVIDVRDLGAIRLVQRQCVTVKNAAWSSVWSQLSWDLDQAHKMIGLFSDARANVISVPVNYYAQTDTDDGWYWYRPESAVGLMSYDVSVDNPAKPPSEQAVLKNWGTVIHQGGQVNRSIVFAHQAGGAPARRMMVNLSDTHVSVVDLEDLANPVTRSTIEVAPYHARLYRFGEYLVDEVRLGGESWWQPGASEFRVKRAAAGLDDAAPVATFTVGRVDRVVQWKDQLLLFRPVGDPSTQDWRYRVSKTEVVAFDLSDPTHPRRRGSVELDADLGVGWGFWCGTEAWGYWPGWYGGSSLATSAEGVAALVRRYDSTGWGQTLFLVNATNPDALEVKQKALSWTNYGSTYVAPAVEYLNLLSGGESSSGVVLASRRNVGTLEQADTTFTQYKYFAEHHDGALVNDWSVNTPGTAIRVFQAGDTTRLLSLDARYESTTVEGRTTWTSEQRLNLLTRRGNAARLSDSRLLGDRWLADLVGDAGRLFLNLQRNWWYGGVAADSTGGVVSSAEGSNRLLALDLSQDRLDQRFVGSLGVTSTQLMGLHGNRLFVNLSGDGVLVVDVSSLAAPVAVDFLRTLGWATHLAFTERMVFVASGYFGVFELDLTAPATIGSN